MMTNAMPSPLAPWTPADQFMLGVALAGEQVVALCARQPVSFDSMSRSVAEPYSAGSRDPEQVQIRSVQEQNSRHLVVDPAPSRRKGPR